MSRHGAQIMEAPDRGGEEAGPTLAGDSTPIAFRDGTDRAVSPAVTLDRVRPFMKPMGITRVANVTHLDRIGIPVVTVCRPNSRSLSVSQGKGRSLVAAQVSGLMESVESYHAEHIEAPLVLGSHRELRARRRVVDVAGLPRLSAGSFHPDLPLLWIEGVDLVGGGAVLVPYDMVHTDFRVSLPGGSGAFLMSSNGLASGNSLSEAVSHAICELVERDGNTLLGVSGRAAQARRKVDPATVDDAACREMLERFEAADIGVAIWDTSSDVGIASFLATVVDRSAPAFRPMPPVSGSGCHPRRGVALLRALSEAAQGRLNIISGSRDDLSEQFFDGGGALLGEERRRLLEETKSHSATFRGAPDVDHATFEADIRWELERLAGAGLGQVVAVDLTRPECGIPVVRVVVPHLEAMSEVSGYVLGKRAHRVMAEAAG